MKRGVVLLITMLLGVTVYAQQFKNIKVNLSGTITNGMVLRYDQPSDTWYPTATIPSGSASYIWTSTSVQNGANFWISGNGKANILRVVTNSGAQGGTGGFNLAAANDSLYWTIRPLGAPSGAQGGFGMQFTAYGGNVVQSNPLLLYRNGDVELGGNLSLNNATSNLIQFPALGLGAPTVTTRSIGTKLLLYPGLSGTSVDYALGMESGNMWFSTASAGSGFNWYASTARIMGLSGAGTLTVGNGLGTAVPSSSYIVLNRKTDVAIDQNEHGYNDVTIFEKNNPTFAYASYDARTLIQGTANYDHYVTFQSLPQYSGSGTLTNFYGAYIAGATTAGTITNRYGVIVNDITGAGAVTNNYGLFVNSLSKGTNNYSIFTGTAPTRLGGDLQLHNIATSAGTGYTVDWRSGSGTGTVLAQATSELVSTSAGHLRFKVRSAAGTPPTGMTEVLTLLGGSTPFVGVGEVAPAAQLHVTRSGEQIRAAFDASNYLSTQVASTGAATLTAVGSSPSITLANNSNVNGLFQVTRTTEQQRIRYDASNYFSTTVSSTGSTVFAVAGTSPVFTFNQLTNFTNGLTAPGGITTNSTSLNLWVGTTNASTLTTTSQYLFGGATGIYSRVGIRGSTSNTMGVGTSSGSFVIGTNDITTASSGTHAVIASAVIKAPTVTSGGAGITNMASLYIEDAPTSGTTNSAIKVNTGDTRLQNTFITAPTYTSGGNLPVVLNSSTGRLETTSTSVPTLDAVTTAGNTTSNIVNVGSIGVSNVASINGSINIEALSVTGDQTLSNSHFSVIVNNSGTATITLPTAGGSAANRIYVIKKVSAASNNVVIDGFSTETIDGQLTQTLTLQYSSVMIQSDGTNWVILSAFAGGTSL